MKYHVVIVKPADNPHAEAYREIAETLMFGLRGLGHEATIATNVFGPSDGLNILLCAHLLRPEQVAQVPANTVIYNLEQAAAGSPWMLGALPRMVDRFEVWDYSVDNIRRFKALGLGTRFFHLPVGWVPELGRIASVADQDIDILFYGSMNQRRRHVLDSLHAAGLKVVWCYGVYGAERDAAIARSKVVLNVHFYIEPVFEIVRVSYLMANRKAVVTEDGADVEPRLLPGLAVTSYTQLVDCCCELAADAHVRRGLEEAGFTAFSGLKATEFLSRVLDLRAG